MVSEYKTISETGLVRKENQDAIFASLDGKCGLFVVADGMGGHSHGERASAAMTDGLAKWWSSLDKQHLIGTAELAQEFRSVIMNESRNVFEEFENIGEKGGCTVCAMLIIDSTYIICNVGDSRAYFYEKGLKQLTLDDVWQNMQGVRGKLPDEQLKQDPRYGQLTQAAGYDKEIAPRITRGFLNKGTVILLCTDGIYKYCPEKELAGYLKGSLFGSKLEKKIENIRKKVIANGAKDNYSAIVVEIR